MPAVFVVMSLSLPSLHAREKCVIHNISLRVEVTVAVTLMKVLPVERLHRLQPHDRDGLWRERITVSGDVQMACKIWCMRFWG